jgi:hypothetical protein
VPRLIAGLAAEAAFPVPFYMDEGIYLPHQAYEVAEAALAKVSAADGAMRIVAAEAGYLAANDSAQADRLLKEGLESAPASARGWALLAERLASSNRATAAQAWRQSVTLGPYEYRLLARRGRLAALLWSELDDQDRAAARMQVRLLWPGVRTRPGLFSILASPGGPALFEAAFADEPAVHDRVEGWMMEERTRVLRRLRRP